MSSKESSKKFVQKDLQTMNNSTKKHMGYKGWYETIYIWFRYFITQPIMNVTKQLYLYGPPAVGKSQAILEIIGDENINFCFFTSTGKYAFDGLDIEKHTIVILEQFQLKNWKSDLGNLNQFLCGQFFTINRKWKASIKARYTGMIIIITRESRITDKGLDARLYQVHASSPYTAEELISYQYIP